MEIEQLRGKIKDDYKRRKYILHRNHGVGESRTYEGAKPTVGISHARMAIKKNIKTIVTVDSTSNLGKGSPGRAHLRTQSCYSNSPGKYTPERRDGSVDSSSRSSKNFIAMNRNNQGKTVSTFKKVANAAKVSNKGSDMKF
jgi:hypothetical protein